MNLYIEGILTKIDIKITKRNKESGEFSWCNS